MRRPPRAAAGHAPSDVFIFSLSHSLRYSAVIALVGAVVAAAFIRSHRQQDAAVPAEDAAMAEAA